VVKPSPNIALPRPRFLWLRFPLTRKPSGARGAVLLVALAALPIAAGIRGAALDQTSEPARTAELSWNFEAPDMPDVQAFNESGSRTLPIVVLRSADCDYPFDSLKVHLFQFMKGSSRGKDHKPMTEHSNGVVITIARKSNASMPALTVGLVGSGSDWSAYESFPIPRLSAAQWAALPTETSWVFEFPGHRIMGSTTSWNKIEVKCK
jgi:hypothetical protein